VVASYLTTWQLAPEQLFDPTSGPHSFDLTVGLARFAGFFRGQRNALELHYEDLVQSPADAVARVCRFLGIGCESGLEKYGADERLAQRSSRRMGDRKLFDHAQPHAGSIGRWKTGLSDAQIDKTLSTIGRRYFERMGYVETLAELDRRGFSFAGDDAVEENLAEFEAAAIGLPWTLRGREIAAPPPGRARVALRRIRAFIPGRSQKR
jgi:sulfotransferase family protein